MNKKQIDEIRRLRDIGISMLTISIMLQVEPSEVWQASSEPDEDTIIDGERLENRVRRLTKELREQRMVDLRNNNARIRE